VTAANTAGCPAVPLRFQIDHVIAQKHRGPTVESNLALSCFWCNAYKGPNIAGIDPKTRQIVPLFNPRTDRWTVHFRWDGPLLVGISAAARATIEVLEINHPVRVALRESLIAEGVFPSTSKQYSCCASPFVVPLLTPRPPTTTPVRSD
jgi:hypothetical protein